MLGSLSQIAMLTEIAVTCVVLWVGDSASTSPLSVRDYDGTSFLVLLWRSAPRANTSNVGETVPHTLQLIIMQ